MKRFKEIVLFVAMTFATCTVSAQNEDLWIDYYESVSVIDTVRADSIEAVKNANYNAKQKDRAFNDYAKKYLDRIVIIDKLIEAEKNELVLMESKRIPGSFATTMVPTSEENGKLYSNLCLFKDDEKTTKADLKAIDKGKVPKGFTERVLLPTKVSIQEMIDKFVPPVEETKYEWRSGKGWSSSSVPKKEVKILSRKPNPECRVNYFNGNMDGVNKYLVMWRRDSPEKVYSKYSWDEAQQSQGWEWVKNKGEMETKEVFFPTKKSYKFHPLHPEYRFNACYDCSLDAYDENGRLVRVDNLIGNNVIHIKMTENVMLAICKRDFLANKYDINKAEKKTLDALRIRFGIVDGLDERYKQYKEMYIASLYEMKNATTPDEYGAAMARHDVALKVLKEYLYKQIDQQADNYIDQLKADHENELKYIYKIERIDNTTFKLYYLNDKMECGCVALMKWFNKASYECDYDIELLPIETIAIKR